MRNYVIVGLAGALLAACSGSADKDGDGKISEEEMAAEAENVQLKAGEWEKTVEFVDVEISNIPEDDPKQMLKGMLESMKGEKVTTKECISEEEAKKPAADFFSGDQKDECDVTEFAMRGGTISSKMACKDPKGAVMNMTMSGDYAEDNYDMEMEMSGKEQDIDLKITARSSGKYIGDCPAEGG